MVFNTGDNLTIAKELISSDKEHELYYACLELRYALEKVVYQKLKLRLEKITIEEIAAWQPKKALDRLMELVDEHLKQDTSLSMAREKELGVVADDAVFMHVGTTKGVDPKQIGKHWQKLGSYLHIKMPLSNSDHPEKPSSSHLKTYLEEVVKYVEELTSTNFDAYFSQNVTFKCGKCSKSIVRNRVLLKTGDIVQCQTPECVASYKTEFKNDDILFEPYLFNLECTNCRKEVSFEANAFLKMPYTSSRIAQCHGCDHKFYVRWQLEYASVKQGEPVETKTTVPG